MLWVYLRQATWVIVVVWYEYGAADCDYCSSVSETSTSRHPIHHCTLLVNYMTGWTTYSVYVCLHICLCASAVRRRCHLAPSRNLNDDWPSAVRPRRTSSYLLVVDMRLLTSSDTADCNAYRPQQHSSSTTSYAAICRRTTIPFICCSCLTTDSLCITEELDLASLVIFVSRTTAHTSAETFW